MTTAPVSVFPALGQPVANPNTQADNPANTESAQSEEGNAATPQVIQPFAIHAGVGLNEYYDSNATGLQNGRSDYTTQGVADLNVHDQTARFQGDLSYSVSGYYHANQSQLNAVENYLNGVGHAELYEDHLYLNARAFAWPTFASRLGSLDAGGDSTANSLNAYGYVVDPDLVWRFDDFATSHLTLTESGEFFSDLSNASLGTALPFGGPVNATATGISEQLKGGQYFGRLEWVATAMATNSSQAGFHDKQRSAEADLEYHIDHNFGVILDGGYRSYDTQPSLTRGVSGPIAMGGLAFQPNETFSAVVKAGIQYQFTSVTGSLRYQFTPTSQVFATLDDIVTTPQDRLLLGLGGLDVSQGGFYLPGTLLPNQGSLPGLPANNGQPVNVAPLDGLALDNIISRYRTATFGLVHRMPRDTLTATAYGVVRDYLLPLPGFDMRQTVYGGDLSYTHQFDRDLNGSLSGDYSVAHEFGGTDKIGTFSAFLSYTISREWSANFRLSYIDRVSRESIVFSNGTLDDVQVGLGIRYNFL